MYRSSNQPSDTSLLEPNEKILAGNASSVAVVNYAVRTLQIMFCESSMFKRQLMCDPKFHSWRLVFAFLPVSENTPQTFFNITWKMNQDGKWRAVNASGWQALFRDLRVRKTNALSTRIQLHGTDLAHLPFAAKIKSMRAPTSLEVVCHVVSRSNPRASP